MVALGGGNYADLEGDQSLKTWRPALPASRARTKEAFSIPVIVSSSGARLLETMNSAQVSVLGSQVGRIYHQPVCHRIHLNTVAHQASQFHVIDTSP